MKRSRLMLLLAMLIVPWLTVPFLGRKSFKKYILSSSLMYIFIVILDVFGLRKRWWTFYKGIQPLNSMGILRIGPYFVTSLWMLKMAYGKYLLYIISNTILHILFIYVGLRYTKKYKILSLDRMTKLQYFGLDFVRGNMLYGVQYVIEHLRRSIKKDVS